MPVGPRSSGRRSEPVLRHCSTCCSSSASSLGEGCRWGVGLRDGQKGLAAAWPQVVHGFGPASVAALKRVLRTAGLSGDADIGHTPAQQHLHQVKLHPSLFSELAGGRARTLADRSQDPLPLLFHGVRSVRTGPEHLYNEVLDGTLQLVKVSVLQAVVAADVGGDVVGVGLVGVEGDVGVAA